MKNRQERTEIDMICIDKNSQVFKVEGKVADIIAEMSGLAAMMTKQYCEQTGKTLGKGLEAVLDLIKSGAADIMAHWVSGGKNGTEGSGK